MRMIHYYTGLAVLLPVALFATAFTGALHDGTQKHLALGLFTGIYCVAVHTLFILFMIVTGRVLKAAMQSRPLGPEFLDELNVFFAKKSAYPMAILAAFLAVATAVLGHGGFIGVPTWIHYLLGLFTVLFNLFAVRSSYLALRDNQNLIDRTAAELDRIDAELGPESLPSNEPTWAFGTGTRWLVFAVSAWLPYLYWGWIVWRGDFGRIGLAFPLVSAVASAFGLMQAWRSRWTEPPGDGSG